MRLNDNDMLRRDLRGKSILETGTVLRDQVMFIVNELLMYFFFN